MVTTRVEIGLARGPNDGSRRYLPEAIAFDTRPLVLSTVVDDDWEPAIRSHWLANQSQIREGVLHEYGAQDFDQKITNFADLGAAPWSLIALHNIYLRQVRSAFVSLNYYAALLGACGLGERILNQLILTLRDDYRDHEATRYVAKKKALDDWKVGIRTLREWGVFDDSVAREYLSLMDKRHAAVHYRSELDSGEAREVALAAVVQLSELVQGIFSPFDNHSYFFTGPIGRSFVCRDAETIPFVRHFILPASVLVSPAFRFVSEGAGLEPYDDPSIGVGQPDLTDDEFAHPSRATPQVPYPF